MVMSDLPSGRALAKAFMVSDDMPYAVNQRVCCITSLDVHPKFLFYQVDRNQQLLSHDDGVSQTHLPNSAFTKLLLLVPHRREQEAIAEYLDGATAQFDTLSAEAERAAALLQERRTALISAAVTGRIDVRNLESGMQP
jgi:type I restriction enzyme S subunit